MVSTASFPGLSLVRARDIAIPTQTHQMENIWSLENLCGRLVEISEGTAAGLLTFVADIIRRFQRTGAALVWVAGVPSVFYPPDVQQAGIELESLPVVWAPGKIKSLQVLELVVRSGAFGLVVADLGSDWRVGDGALGRLLKLAELRGIAVVFLTRKRADEPSIGSMISLRAEITRTDAHLLVSSVTIVKDKRYATSMVQRNAYHGPRGMH